MVQAVTIGETTRWGRGVALKAVTHFLRPEGFLPRRVWIYRKPKGACLSAVRGKRCVRFLPRGKWVLEKVEQGCEGLFTTIFDQEPSVAWQDTALMISKRRDAGFTEGFNKAGGI